jgi:hypothetical protein
LAVASATLVSLAGCGADENPVMPDVTGQKLDIAQRVIKDAGFTDGVKVDGGGALGIIRASNWEVCGQSPAAGEPATDAPRLTVDRSCPDGAEPSATSDPSETSTEAEGPDASASGGPDAGQVLTRTNSEELAALLAVSDSCDASIAPFVANHGGRTIAFDGSIVDVANHGDDDTRYDMLLAPGNKGPQSTVGPAFKFEDVNVSDLNLTGDTVADSVDEGDRFRFVAEVVRYNAKQCLLFLAPVSTTVR